MVSAYRTDSVARLLPVAAVVERAPLHTGGAGMMTRFRAPRRSELTLFLACSLNVAVAVLPEVAHAEPESSAATGADPQRTIPDLMRAGVAEYNKQRYEPAYDKFMQAWQIERHYVIAASLADVEMKLDRYRDAAEHWEFYLNNLPPELAGERASAESKLAECRKRLVKVRVAVDVANAEISVDDALVGTAPLQSELWLEPGLHKFQARRSDRNSRVVQFSAAAGHHYGVNLKVEQPPAPGVSAPSVSAPSVSAPSVFMLGPDAVKPPRDSGSTARTFVTIGGGVATAAALGFAIFYKSKEGSASEDADVLRQQTKLGADAGVVAQHNQCNVLAGRSSACDALDDKVKEQRTAHDIATASFVAAGALGAATIAAYLFWPSERHESPKNARHQHFTIAPWTMARGAQVSLSF